MEILELPIFPSLFVGKLNRVKKDFGNSYQTVQDIDKNNTQTKFKEENTEIILPFDSEAFKNKWELCHALPVGWLK